MKELTLIEIVISSCQFVIALSAVIGNAFIITVFIKDHRLKKRKSNLLFASQVFSDLFVGLIGIPLGIVLYLQQIKSHSFCVFTISTILALRNVSINGILAISYDRYKAMSNPIGYATSQSKIGLKFSIFFTWTLGLMAGYGVYFFSTGDEISCGFKRKIKVEYAVVLQVVSSVIPFAALIFVYTYVYVALRKVHMNHKCDACSNNQKSARTICQIRKREYQATNNMLGIVASFAVCKFPLFIIHIIYEYFESIEKDRDLLQILIAINHLTTMINPILYAFHLKDFRKACSKFVGLKVNNEVPNSSFKTTPNFRAVIANSSRGIN